MLGPAAAPRGGGFEEVEVAWVNGRGVGTAIQEASDQSRGLRVSLAAAVYASRCAHGVHMAMHMAVHTACRCT